MLESRSSNRLIDFLHVLIGDLEKVDLTSNVEVRLTWLTSQL